MTDYLVTLGLVFVAGYAAGWLQVMLWLAWQLYSSK